MRIIELIGAEEKARAVSSILNELPAWFGLPEATAAYVDASRHLTCFAAVTLTDEVVGFVTLEQSFAKTAEINAMGILPNYHRQGIGQDLMMTVLVWCQEGEIDFLQVKTLADNHPDENYAKTRLFYKNQGFTELEVFPTLWGADNPCLQLIMAVTKKN